MGTLVGVGCSANRNSREAGQEAALMALEKAGNGKPDFVFVFATIGYNQQILISSIRETTSGARLSGCSGEGVITQGMVSETNFGVCVMVINSDEIRFDNVYVKEITKASDFAGERLAKEVQPFLASDSKVCFVFADGLVFDFDPFRASFEKTIGADKHIRLIGGLSADNWTARRTYQYHDDQVFSEGISCVLLSGPVEVASGISHGCVPVGTKHTITRSKGNKIYEIDGIKALDAFRDYVEDDWKDQWNKVSMNLCLGFRTPEHIKKDYGEFIVRYMVGKDDEEGYVTIQSDVQEGTDFWIVRRDKELIRAGLQTISSQIKGKAGGRKPKFIMQFECMGRGKVVFMEHEKKDLIRSLQKQIGEETPWIGFYTYGEIGPVSGYNCMHNFTAVVIAVF